ncbi:hypothetical protein CONPUDRAFT_56935 [Coniophora puteana RWD-64-598 SS2]|uniref:BTB domain-containing protein n=1 Tax=Coniophora puteana (strain RWD-64-598) TaxID=741705 RepID=A0A5M3MMM7_CONPW|nr:uncharacterized protein CONPUDRAFT_56935 [Coniophora puteana RWD-64-598 SS2]EIW80428.1 hypothetical protein CONPUDRAFT_56935 [Coniophora puteana RWD-64-598 SS2]
MQFVQEPPELSEEFAPSARTCPEYTKAFVPSQIPTPPPSDTETSPDPTTPFQDSFTAAQTSTPESDPPDETSLTTVSRTFRPDSRIHTYYPDLVLLSSDSIHFYISYNVLYSLSSNAFNGLLPMSQNQPIRDAAVINVPEHSDVLNVVLHTVYGVSCSQYAPAFESLSAAVGALDKYGYSLSQLVAPSTPLYTLLLSHAPLYPIEVYTLASRHDIFDLAVPTSAHLLSFSLPSLSEDAATRMGPKYLKRLFFLHLGRTDALKRVLLSPPHPHPPTSNCSFDNQKGLTRAWALASAYLVWDARPDMSVSMIESTLSSLGKNLQCDTCEDGLQARIKNVVGQWCVVKVSLILHAIFHT